MTTCTHLAGERQPGCTYCKVENMSNDEHVSAIARLAHQESERRRHSRALANELARVAQLTLGVANEHAEKGGLPIRFLVATEQTQTGGGKGPSLVVPE